MTERRQRRFVADPNSSTSRAQTWRDGLRVRGQVFIPRCKSGATSCIFWGRTSLPISSRAIRPRPTGCGSLRRSLASSDEPRNSTATQRLQLELVLREAARVAGETEFVLVGSQAVHAHTDKAPMLRMSLEGLP